MIDEKFLNNLISNSFYPETLANIIGMERDETVEYADFGHFFKLDSCCSISLGLCENNSDNVTAGGASSCNDLSEVSIKNVCDVLNANNFPAVSQKNADDPSKILVTGSGIQLPFQTAEDSLSMLSDIVDVLKENKDVRIRGYAHHLVKDSLTMAKIGTFTTEAKIEDNVQNANILAEYGISKETFINEMLTDAKDIALSADEIHNLENNVGISLYRGGTLGSRPYAVVTNVESKKLVYASANFADASYYANIHNDKGYKSSDGTRYGFIYEYELSNNQKFYTNWGLESGAKGKKIDEQTYETDIYNNKNRLKNIYFKCGNVVCKITDENGYISKKWADFAKLHDPVNCMDSENLVVRNNVMYEAAQEDRALCSYSKRKYNYEDLSVEEIQKYMSGNQSVRLTGTIKNTGIFENIDTPFIIKNACIENVNLNNITNLTLSGNTRVEEGVQLPDNLELRDVKLNTVDLSNVKNLSMTGSVELAERTELPANVKLDSLQILKIHDTDVMHVQKLSSVLSVPIVILDKDDRPLCAIGKMYGQEAEKFDKYGYTELKRFSSLEAYNKCKSVEEKLTSWGIDKDSYMMITPEHNVYTSYGDIEYKSMQTCFDECKKDLQNADTNVVYGSNNGIVAAYFAEDVYIISKNPELRNVLYHKGQDTNISVVMSNGEEFRTERNWSNTILNQQYAKISSWKPKEQSLEKENISSQVMSESVINNVKTDKERIAVLSGRAEQSTKTVIQSEDKSVVEQMTEQVPMPKIQEPTKLNNISPKPSEQKISAEPMSKQLSGKVSDMSKKEKATFFVNLRKGVNMLLSKVSFGKEKTTENQVTQNRETSIVQTQVINKVTAQGR